MLCALWMELGFCSCTFLLTKRLWPIVTTLTRSILCVQWKYTSRRLWHFNIFPTMRIIGKHWQYSQDVCCVCSLDGALPTGGSAVSTFSCTKGAVAYTDTFNKAMLYAVSMEPRYQKALSGKLQEHAHKYHLLDITFKYASCLLCFTSLLVAGHHNSNNSNDKWCQP